MFYFYNPDMVVRKIVILLTYGISFVLFPYTFFKFSKLPWVSIINIY